MLVMDEYETNVGSRPTGNQWFAFLSAAVVTGYFA
jgi:hypothetical protein